MKSTKNSKNNIKCIIVDDQSAAINVIIEHLTHRTEFELITFFTDSVEALNFLVAGTHKIDLVFVDIQMPYLNGLDFAETMQDKMGIAAPRVVFTTGHDEYALSGFEHGAIDYLLKPIGFKRFNHAMDRILNNWVWQPNKQEVAINRDFFFAEVDGVKLRINFNDIAYIESSGNYITFIGPGLKKLVYKSLNAIQEILPLDYFVRVHKSFIISINYLEAVKGNELVLKIGQETKLIPIGATFKDDIQTKLNI